MSSSISRHRSYKFRLPLSLSTKSRRTFLDFMILAAHDLIRSVIGIISWFAVLLCICRQWQSSSRRTYEPVYHAGQALRSYTTNAHWIVFAVAYLHRNPTLNTLEHIIQIHLSLILPSPNAIAYGHNRESWVRLGHVCPQSRQLAVSAHIKPES